MPFTSPALFGQPTEKVIKGKVIDAQTFEPLPLANIVFKDSEIGTTTDLKGKFIISNSINASEMIISFIGYKSLTVDLNSVPYDSENLFMLLPTSILLQEVTVYSNTNRNIDITEISSLSMQSQRIREISAGMPDILRSVQALPGIAVNNEFKADFNVRGGNQDENLVLVNNAQVYSPFHIKEVANASVGIFNVDLINKVDLITGGFSARYGDKMSSVLNIQYREGNKERYSGAASLGLAYLDGYVEGPITESGSFIFGIRKSYLEYLISLIDYEDITSMKPAFYDLQGVLSYNIAPTNKILFEFIHAGDNFTYNPTKQKYSSPYIALHNGFEARFQTSVIDDDRYKASYFSNLFDVQSINTISSTLSLKGEISYYEEKNDEHRLSLSDYTQDIKLTNDGTSFFDRIHRERLTYDTLTIKTLELKSDIGYQISPNYELNFGISYKNITYNQHVDDIWTFIRNNNLVDPNTVMTDTIISKGELAEDTPVDVKSYKFSTYVENVFQAADNFTVNAGGRIDYFDLNRELTFSPRLSAGYRLDELTTIRAAWGYYYQSPFYRQLLSSSASDTNTKSQLAVHYILGLEHFIPLSNSKNNFLKVKIEGYYKDYRNIISSWFGTFERLTYSKRNDAKGSAKGIDVHAVFNIPHFYCWLSYGLLFAKEDKLTDEIGEYPRYTDQRHTISFVSRIDFGADWSFTLKGFFGSGFPYTPRTALNNNGSWEWQSEKIHSAHLPPYKRIDVRISKDFNFSNSSLNVFIDVSNVFNFKNIQGYEYKTPGFTQPSAEEVPLWPIIPSLGLRYQF